MSFFELNDTMQRATSPHTWITWRGVYDGAGRYVGQAAYVANCKSSSFIGMDGDGIDYLLMRLPSAEMGLAW